MYCSRIHGTTLTESTSAGAPSIAPTVVVPLGYYFVHDNPPNSAVDSGFVGYAHGRGKIVAPITLPDCG